MKRKIRRFTDELGRGRERRGARREKKVEKKWRRRWKNRGNGEKI